jgi:hypothetical protein
MLMTDWMMIHQFRHHRHQPKKLDAELCIISSERRKKMCSSGLQSFVMPMLVGHHRSLHVILSRRVCHMRSCMHLQMDPTGFDLCSIHKAFYSIHPEGFLTAKHDVGKIAWTLYFGRRLNSADIPINPDFARVFAEYGHLNGDHLSSLVLAMIDRQKSLQIFTELSDRSVFWHIAWANAVDNDFQVPRNREIFDKLRQVYWELKQVSNNCEIKDGIFSKATFWEAGALCMDAIYSLCRITQKRVPGHIKKEFNPPMAPIILKNIPTHSFHVKSLRLVDARDGVELSMDRGSATNSSHLTIHSTGNQKLELSSKEVEGQKVVLACSRKKDFHSFFPSVWTILFLSDYCFLSLAVTEIKFWNIKKTSCSKGDDYQIILLATLDLPKFVGPNVKIDLIRLFRRHIFLWINSGSQLVVIPYSVSENGVFLGKRFTFPFTYICEINKGDDSESFFEIIYTVLSNHSTIVTYSRTLNCAGEEPFLEGEPRKIR